MTKRILLYIIMAFYSLYTYSQGFKVKEFKLNINATTAYNAPVDSEGHPCGLIKIRTSNPDLQFKGDIIGEVENKMNEYWVYLPHNSQQLKILHPNFMPLIVSFSEYGIEISSKATYILTLEEVKYKKEKAGVTIVVKPEDSELYIDDCLIDNLNSSGLYQLFLPKGEHACKLSKEGYQPYAQIIQTGKAPQLISVELESVMAELEVKSKTSTAEIYIDGELKGNGLWKGNLLAGSHMIEARQENFEPQTVKITLEEKDSKILSIPELKRLKRKLKIVTSIPQLPVLLDGVYAGVSPCEVVTETGEHYVSCNAFGCLPYRKNIVVDSGTSNPITVNLQFDSHSVFAEYYPKAYSGDLESMKVLAANTMLKPWRNGSENVEEAVFWRERIEKIDSKFFSSESGKEFGEEWLWTYNALAKEYEDKGEFTKAIHCYRMFLKIMSNEWTPDEYTEYEDPQSTMGEISNKIKELERKR